jgi:hypothetical protein
MLNNKQLVAASKLWLHELENYDLHVEKHSDLLHICGHLNRSLILHSNIKDRHVEAKTSIFSVNFKCSGSFEFIKFRVTSDRPSDCFKECIIYSHSRIKSYRLVVDRFDISKPICVEFSVFGLYVDLWLSDIEIVFSPHVLGRSKEVKNLPSFVKQYTQNSFIRDYDLLLCPEPHSQERGLVVLQNLNLQAKTTIDLGAGSIPFMSDLVLQHTQGAVDCLVYGEHDTLIAKRLLSSYGERVNIFSGDLLISESIPDKTYDQILLIDVLEHIEEDLCVLENIKKLFHQNTRLIISVPNTNYKQVFSEEFHNLVGHKRDGYSIDSLTTMLENSGFIVKKSFNYSIHTKYFYEFWYKEVKAWSNGFAYSKSAFIKATEFQRKLKKNIGSAQSNSVEEGASNLLICRLS